MTHESDKQRRIRRVRSDGRSDDEGTVVSYLKEDNTPIAWTGDQEAPYVKVIDFEGDLIINATITPTASPVNALDWSDSVAAEAQRTAKAAAGRVYQFYVSNEFSVDLFFQIFNRAVVLVGGEVPVWTVRIPTRGVGFVDYGVFGRFMSLGITWGASTTYATYTAPVGGGLWVNTGYK